MTNILRVDHENKTLVMDKTFEKNSSIFGSRESQMLEEARRAYPTYTVARRQIKKNTHQEHYNGLTYEYMRWYIQTHEEGEALTTIIKEFEELLLISKCHSKGKRYPTIKKWFLELYPEVKTFGMSAEQLEAFQKAQEEKELENAEHVIPFSKVEEEKKVS